MITTRVAEAVRRALAEPDATGATIHPETWEQPTTGYAVAVANSPELRIAGPDGPTIIGTWLNLPSVYNLLQQEHGRHHVGAWVDDDGRLCLDVVEVIADREAALTAAAARGEDAVYCLDTGDTVYTFTDGPCRP